MINRTTRYVTSVKDYLSRVGHASNVDVLEALKADYPKLTATTIHRITDRLVDLGQLGMAPYSAKHNAMRFDNNIDNHDHFKCQICDRLKDVKIPDRLVKSLRSLVPGCQISGSLTIMGVCADCLKISKA